MDTQRIRIVVADARAIVGVGISKILAANAALQVDALVHNPAQVFSFSDTHKFDLIVFDIDFPDPIAGIKFLHQFHIQYPQVRVVVLTNTENEAIVRWAVQEGVFAYLLKNIFPEELVAAIQAACLGRFTFSPEIMPKLAVQETEPVLSSFTRRENEVLDLMSLGWDNQMIAGELGISVATVQFHVGNILRKLAVKNRTEAAAFALQHKIERDSLGFSRSDASWDL